MTQRMRQTVPEVPTTFGARLRHERERRKISIASIAENTKILGALLEGLENDDVSRWPTGFYRRAFIRAYATAVGLDAEAIVREFSERFPDPEAMAMTASPAAVAPMAPATGEPGRDRKLPTMRVAVPEAATWFTPGSLIRNARLRLFAVAVDAFVLCVMGLGLFVVLGSFWAPLALAMATYYFGSILMFGNTPGVCLFAARRPPAAGTEAGGGPAFEIPPVIDKILRRNHLREAATT